MSDPYYTLLGEVLQRAEASSTHNEDSAESTNKMWSWYLEYVKDYDERIANEWKEDADGVLVFVSPGLLVPTFSGTIDRKTGIFSATVAAFIIESYKKLSPDSSDQTVFLLGQISQQLSGLANATNVQPLQHPSSPPTLSIICVNVVWLLSLVFSTTSALLAILMQQWARRYIQLPQRRSIPTERARVRSFLFLGAQKYLMYRAVEITRILLHSSVFLFNVGLVIFFFTIFKEVAIILLVAVGIFGVAYLILTILPYLDYEYPFSTPMSSMPWYFWHIIAFLPEICFHFVLKDLHALLVPPNLGEVVGGTQHRLTEWLDYFDNPFQRRWKGVTDGFQESVIDGALDASSTVDARALTWLFKLPALAEKSEIQTFVAIMPGETIVQLFRAPSQRGIPPFREHLLALMRTCAPGTVGLEKDARNDRLLVCLNAIRRAVKASILPSIPRLSLSESARVLNDVRTDFANISLMRALWDDPEPSIRIAARSICALLARHLLRQDRLEASQLAWLQDVLGQPSHLIYNRFNTGNIAALDNMNIDAFVYGVLSNQTDDLPISQVISFADTLVILMRAGSQISLRSDNLRTQLTSLIERIADDDHQHRDNVLEQLYRIFDNFLSDSGSQMQASRHELSGGEHGE